MSNLLNPSTGERPINAWIVFLVIFAALVLLATLLAPVLPKIAEFFKKIIKK